MTNPTPTIRALLDSELRQAFHLVVQLREHLDFDEFGRRIARQKALGYTLAAAFIHEEMVGVIGMRIVSTLARGEHLHIDDLVVDTTRRGHGVGLALMRHAEEWARNHGCQSVFLDSRPEVLTFYARLGYAPHSATLVRKSIQ